MMPGTDQLLLLLPLIFLVAVLYSSVGHGGASGYLAVISLMGFATKSFVPIVLTLNVLVAGISFFNYRKPGTFTFRRLLPFILTSIPASYLGGLWKVSDATFGMILGIALLLAALRLVLPKRNDARGDEQVAVPHSSFLIHHSLPKASLWAIGLPVGLVLGFISGMIGIGGGIFLSPILLFLGITDIKGSAAMASAFIVLNSLAGLAGHASSISGLFEQNAAALLAFIVVAIAGAFLGSRWGASRTQARTLQYVLSSVLVLASVKLLVDATL